MYIVWSILSFSFMNIPREARAADRHYTTWHERGNRNQNYDVFGYQVGDIFLSDCVERNVVSSDLVFASELCRLPLLHHHCRVHQST